MRAAETAVCGDTSVSPGEVCADWADPRFDMARDTWVVVAPDGCLTAYALCWAIHTANPVDLSFEVHPDHAGVGIDESLLGNLLARAREHLRSRPSTSRDSGIALWCPRGDERKETLYDASAQPARGSSCAWRSTPPSYRRHRLGRPASRLRPSAVVPTTPTCTPRSTKPSASTSSPSALPLDIWQTVVLGDADFDPELFLVARDGRRVAGAVLCFPTPEAGIVDQLAVRKPWRGRGLGKALLLHAMHRMAARGHERFQLGVDSHNATGAADLYRAVGMKTTRVDRLLRGAPRRGGIHDRVVDPGAGPPQVKPQESWPSGDGGRGTEMVIEEPGGGSMVSHDPDGGAGGAGSEGASDGPGVDRSAGVSSGSADGKAGSAAGAAGSAPASPASATSKPGCTTAGTTGGSVPSDRGDIIVEEDPSGSETTCTPSRYGLREEAGSCDAPGTNAARGSPSSRADGSPAALEGDDSAAGSSSPRSGSDTGRIGRLDSAVGSRAALAAEGWERPRASHGRALFEGGKSPTRQLRSSADRRRLHLCRVGRRRGGPRRGDLSHRAATSISAGRPRGVGTGTRRSRCSWTSAVSRRRRGAEPPPRPRLLSGSSGGVDGRRRDRAWRQATAAPAGRRDGAGSDGTPCRHRLPPQALQGGRRRLHRHAAQLGVEEAIEHRQGSGKVSRPSPKRT